MSDNLDDLRKLDLPFNIDEVSPICHKCIRDQLKKYDKYIDAEGIAYKDKFVVMCPGIPKDPIPAERRAELTNEQIDELEAISSPTAFAKKYLYNNEKKPWQPRDYQIPILECRSKRMVLRCSRRIGKTTCVAIRILHAIFTNDKLKVIVVGPQRKHAEDVFNIIREFIANNPFLADSVVKDISSPYFQLELSNGSNIKGFAGGTKGSHEGTAIRGSNADFVFLEEMDRIDDEAIQGAIMPLLYTNANAELIGFSTPSGQQKTFWSLCMQSPIYKEFYYDYTVLPWKDTIEKERSSFTNDQWVREFLALFTVSDHGVYQPLQIDKALHAYMYTEMVYDPAWTYSMGVDWNEKHGAEIAVVGWDPRDKMFKTVETMNVTGGDFTQLASVSAVLKTNSKWKPKFVYIDSGGGSTNAELLMKSARDNLQRGGDPQTAKLLQTLKKYDSGANVKVKDPVTGEEIKKFAKSFMVNASVRLFEQNKIWISSQDSILEKQLRNYIIKRITPTGNPVYGCEIESIEDHRLDAFNLAIVAFQLEFSDLFQQVYSTSVGAVLDPRMLSKNPGETRPERRDIEPNRVGLDIPTVYSQSASHTNNTVGLVNNRPGWAYDLEEREIAKFEQRRYARRSRRNNPPKRSNI